MFVPNLLPFAPEGIIIVFGENIPLSTMHSHTTGVFSTKSTENDMLYSLRRSFRSTTYVQVQHRDMFQMFLHADLALFATICRSSLEHLA